MPARLTQSKRDEILWDVLHDVQVRYCSSGTMNWAALARKHSTNRRTCQSVWRSYQLGNGLDTMPPVDLLSEPPSQIEEGALSDASMGGPSLGEASDVETEGDGEVHENEDSSTETQRSPQPGHLGELQAGITQLKNELEKLLKDGQAGSELVALAARCEELSRSPRIAWIDRWIEPHKMTQERC